MKRYVRRFEENQDPIIKKQNENSYKVTIENEFYYVDKRSKYTWEVTKGYQKEFITSGETKKEAIEELLDKLKKRGNNMKRYKRYFREVVPSIYDLGFKLKGNSINSWVEYLSIYLGYVYMKVKDIDTNTVSVDLNTFIDTTINTIKALEKMRIDYSYEIEKKTGLPFKGPRGVIKGWGNSMNIPEIYVDLKDLKKYVTNFLSLVKGKNEKI